MRDINDTIAAISSASVISQSVGKSIIRVSGPRAFEIVCNLASGDTKKIPSEKRGLTPLIFKINEQLSVEANVYFFRSPNSYTGQDLAEIHVFASECVVETLLAMVLNESRLAEPGEFTLRAYLNGKIDLSQAEAVAAIVSGSNGFQLGAAERLLEGSLQQSIAGVREGMIRLMSMVEAGMDFSEEEIEIISQDQACGEVEGLINELEEVLKSSVRYEEMIDMVSVGLAGKANVGKSSLLNILLGTTRSIVADEYGTTRDVLTGVLELENVRCAVFDCAGIKNNSEEPLEVLANKAAIESLKSAGVVLLCVDAEKLDVDEIKLLIGKIGEGKFIFVLTKCDLVGKEQIKEVKKRLYCIERENLLVDTEILSQAENDVRKTKIATAALQPRNDKGRWASAIAKAMARQKRTTQPVSGNPVESKNETLKPEILNQVQDDKGQAENDKYRQVCTVAVSSKTGEGIEELKKQIENAIVELQAGSQEAMEKIAINQRHKQTIEGAINTLCEVKDNLLSDCNEIAVMLLRGAYQSLGTMQTEHVDEKVLDRIFSQFCIGK